MITNAMPANTSSTGLVLYQHGMNRVLNRVLNAARVTLEGGSSKHHQGQ